MTNHPTFRRPRGRHHGAATFPTPHRARGVSYCPAGLLLTALGVGLVLGAALAAALLIATGFVIV